MNKTRLILDTDIGDDIDDSFALLLALNAPNIDLLGVTTVFRNSDKRAHMAAYLIHKMDKYIPVYAGADAPLLNPVTIDPKIAKKEKLDEKGKYLIPQWMDDMKYACYESKHAIDFIIEQVHKFPHEVVLAPIGPLTNIALAIRKDPSIVPLIKEIRLMGGGLNLDFAEWNLYCDPEAAYIVFNTPIPLYAVGLNVTMKTGLNKDDIEELKNSTSASIKVVYSMMMKWFEHYNFDHPVMHDPLVVSTLVDDKIVGFVPMNMQVDLRDCRGRVYEEKTARAIFMASTIDIDRFRKLFKNLIMEKEDRIKQ